MKAIFILLFISSFLNLSAQKLSTFIGQFDGKEIEASLLLDSGESSGTFFFVNNPEVNYEISTLTKLDNELEVRIISHGNKFASGMLHQTNEGGSIQLKGELTNIDGKQFSFSLEQKE
jgi:hypothetical protein